MRVLVTGATGFVGSRVVELLSKSHEVMAISRSRVREMGQVRSALVGDIRSNTEWGSLLEGVDVVVHCAAKVHDLSSKSSDIDDFRKVNVEGSLQLARHSAKAGVQRFIFLSSIKVNGEFNLCGPFKASDQPQPQGPYAISKMEAEQCIREVCKETGMEYVVIRPPLVYGPGVKANFYSMLNLVAKGWPLPLGALDHNERSLVYLDNLVDLIGHCAHHPKAANSTLLVDDNTKVSTSHLVEKMAQALGVKCRLISVPVSLISCLAALLGKKGVKQRLTSSLSVDSAHTIDTLNWSPPFSMQSGLANTAAWYRANKK